jgi:hypothetical protein
MYIQLDLQSNIYITSDTYTTAVESYISVADYR